MHLRLQMQLHLIHQVMYPQHHKPLQSIALKLRLPKELSYTMYPEQRHKSFSPPFRLNSVPVKLKLIAVALADQVTGLSCLNKIDELLL